MSETFPEPLPTIPDGSEQAASALPRDTRFETSPYRAEGGVNAFGLFSLMAGLMVAGVTLGIGVYFISKWLYLIFLFPVAIGAVLGVIGKYFVKKSKVRSPGLAGVIGFLGGLAAMGTTHYCNYLEFMDDLSKNRDQIQKLAEMDIRDIQVAFQEENLDSTLLKKMAAAHSFWDYLDVEATRGVTLRRAVGRGKGLNLGYSGTWIYWASEAFIVGLIVFLIVRGEAQEPYCSVTDQWKTVRFSARFHVGNGLNAEAVGIMLRDGELGRIAEAKLLGGTEDVRLDIYTSPDHRPECTVDAKLVETVSKKDGKMQEQIVAMATFPNQALEAFEKLCS